MADQRLTLIARDAKKPDIDWNAGLRRDAVAFVGVPALRLALSAGNDLELDIGRVIVDRAGDSEHFLDLLTSLPGEFTGDVLLVRDDGSGVLSATGRGGERVLFALRGHDVRFYLETLDLVTGRVALERTSITSN
jgi:hypothetical protein